MTALDWIAIGANLAMLVLIAIDARTQDEAPPADDAGLDVEAIEHAALALDDGLFEEAEDWLRTALEPNLAEGRWDQFREWMRERRA